MTNGSHDTNDRVCRRAAATASLDAANAQQSQARTWCMTTKADGVSLDLRISGCTTVIQSGKEPKNNLVIAFKIAAPPTAIKASTTAPSRTSTRPSSSTPDADVFNNRGTAYSDNGAATTAPSRTTTRPSSSARNGPSSSSSIAASPTAPKTTHDRALEDYSPGHQAQPETRRRVLQSRRRIQR